jgi:hypothetical protein
MSRKGAAPIFVMKLYAGSIFPLSYRRLHWRCVTTEQLGAELLRVARLEISSEDHRRPRLALTRRPQE